MNQINMLKKQIKECLDNDDFLGAKNQLDKLIGLLDDFEFEVL